MSIEPVALIIVIPLEGTAFSLGLILLFGVLRSRRLCLIAVPSQSIVVLPMPQQI